MVYIEIDENVTLSDSTATNTTEEIPWAEHTITGGLRIWQVIFLAAGAILAIGKKTI